MPNELAHHIFPATGPAAPGVPRVIARLWRDWSPRGADVSDGVCAENLLDALPAGGRVEIVRGAGHFAQVDQPEAVAAAILDYLASG
jgi:pimeloyl-ACP methyl ester carboxylesterase